MIGRALLILFAVGAFSLRSWAQQTEPTPEEQLQEEVDSVRESITPEPPSAGMQREVQPGTSRPEAPPGSAQRRRQSNSPTDAKITVRLAGVPLTVFLKAITQQTKVNFIVSEGLEDKKVAAFLEEVSLDEALRVLLGIRGLAYEKIPGKSYTYLITSRKESRPRTITRIFTLNYIPLQDVQVTVLKGEDSSSGGGLDSGGGGAGGGAASAAIGEGILGILKTLLSTYGQVAVDGRTNSLIITDLPERFPEVEAMIERLDQKIPQVSIESQIIEINSDGLSKIGVEFGGANGEMMRFIGPSRYTDFLMRSSQLKATTGENFFPTSFPSGGGAFVNPGAAINVSMYEPKAGLTFGVLSMAEFQVLLRAIVISTRGKIVSRPRITTLNNKPAEIRITRNQAIGQATVATPGAGSTGSSVERQQTGLILRVIPQINADGYITMVVEPKVTRAVDSLVDNKIKDPITRAAKAMIRVRNGETVVLGGLLDTKEEKSVRKVPLLGDIPVIGWLLFRSRTNEKINSELAIFITPTILDN